MDDYSLAWGEAPWEQATALALALRQWPAGFAGWRVMLQALASEMADLADLSLAWLAEERNPLDGLPVAGHSAPAPSIGPGAQPPQPLQPAQRRGVADPSRSMAGLREAGGGEDPQRRGAADELRSRTQPLSQPPAWQVAPAPPVTPDVSRRPSPQPVESSGAAAVRSGAPVPFAPDAVSGELGRLLALAQLAGQSETMPSQASLPGSLPSPPDPESAFALGHSAQDPGSSADAVGGAAAHGATAPVLAQWLARRNAAAAMPAVDQPVRALTASPAPSTVEQNRQLAVLAGIADVIAAAPAAELAGRRAARPRAGDSGAPGPGASARYVAFPGYGVGPAAAGETTTGVGFPHDLLSRLTERWFRGQAAGDAPGAAPAQPHSWLGAAQEPAPPLPRDLAADSPQPLDLGVAAPDRHAYARADRPPAAPSAADLGAGPPQVHLNVQPPLALEQIDSEALADLLAHILRREARRHGIPLF